MVRKVAQMISNSELPVVLCETDEAVIFQDVVFMDEINNECTILVPKSRKTMAAQGGNPNKSVTFSFDRCYNNKSTTAHIYDEIPYSLVQVPQHF